MDFDLPEEIQILRNTVRKFVDKELIPGRLYVAGNLVYEPEAVFANEFFREDEA